MLVAVLPAAVWIGGTVGVDVIGGVADGLTMDLSAFDAVAGLIADR